MLIRNAAPEDFPAVRRLAEALELDYPGMEADRFWVAEDEKKISGLIALLRHADCLELVSLGVAPEARSVGLGGLLIETLMAAADGDVYLTTVIPEYFESRGFVRTVRAPRGLAKDPAWCEGCDKTRCTIMIRTKK